MFSRAWRIWLSVATIAAIVATLASRLPPDAFVAGDQGVRLVATRNALAHPWRPFDIEPPVVNGTAMPEFVDRFYGLHGEHLHAVTNATFPLLTVPFFALFGLPGLYVLPAIGLLGTLIGTMWMLHSLGVGGRAPVLWLAFISTPLLFYGLEFWEHSSAAAYAYLSTAVFIAPRRAFGASAVAGALMGVAVLMRPEAACYAVALGAASRFLQRLAAPPTWQLSSLGWLSVSFRQ